MPGNGNCTGPSPSTISIGAGRSTAPCGSPRTVGTAGGAFNGSPLPTGATSFAAGACGCVTPDADGDGEAVAGPDADAVGEDGATGDCVTDGLADGEPDDEGDGSGDGVAATPGDGAVVDAAVDADTGSTGTSPDTTTAATAAAVTTRTQRTATATTLPVRAPQVTHRN